MRIKRNALAPEHRQSVVCLPSRFAVVRRNPDAGRKGYIVVGMVVRRDGDPGRVERIGGDVMDKVG